MSKLVFAHGVGVVDLVSEDEEGNLGEFFHGEESIELSLGFGESLEILGIDKEDDAAHFREVVFPETSGCCADPICVNISVTVFV